MRILLANIVFAFVLISCDSNTSQLSDISKDSINKLSKINKVDSIRMADSITKANQQVNKIWWDSLHKKDQDAKNTSQNKTLRQIAEELQSGPIGNALYVYEDEKITYSKNFIASISFTATNNSNKSIDLFCISINLVDGSNPIEKTIDRVILANAKAKIKLSPNVSGKVLNYRVTKIHYSDGTIF